MADDKLVNAYKASRNSKSAPAKGKKQSGKGASILAGARASAPIAAPTKEAEKPKDWWEQTTEVLGGALETPVIKQIIDAISMPGYAVSNSLENIQTRMQDASKKGQARGEVGINNLPNTIQTAWEGLNPGSFVGDIVAGVGQGLSAGVGNRSDVKTSADLIKKGQEFNNIDTNSSESKWVQGLGGFGLDVAMDPLNAVTGLGKAASAAKGAVRGSQQYASEAAGVAASGGMKEMAPGVAPTRWENAKKEAKVEVEKYKELKATDHQAKEVRKQTKKLGAADKANFLIENISTLKPAVFKAVATEEAVAEKMLAKVMDGSMSEAKMAEVVDKMKTTGVDEAEETITKLIDDDVPVEAIEESTSAKQPIVGLAQFKEPTKTEKLFDLLADLRTTNKKAVYDKDTVKAVETARAAHPDSIDEYIPQTKADMTPENQVFDVNATISKVKAFDKAMTTPKNPGGAKFKVGKVYITAKEMIEGLKYGPKDALFQQHWDALDPSTQAYKAPEVGPPTKVSKKNPDALKDEDYIKLGVRPEHVERLRKGEKLSDIVDDISVGDVRYITRDMRAGLIPQKIIDRFFEVVGSKDPKEVAKFIDTEFDDKTVKSLKAYGSDRTGTPSPSLGVSGHGKLAQANKTTTEADILAAKSPANPESTRAFLEAEYNRVALDLASHKMGADLRVFADFLFEGTIDAQRRPAGPRIAKGGASVTEKKAPVQGAKYEKLYNTHSTIWRMDEAVKYARSLEKEGKTKSRYQMDDIIMSILQDVDARLRLAGFDQHLSNMQMVGDKLIVRLAPSDALKVLTKEDRVRYLWGNKAHNGGKTIEEFLPTTLLDLAEVLVRSATKLTPTGQIDEAALINNAIYALQGRYSEVATGKRKIINNLDYRTKEKNDKEILRALDNATSTETNFFEKYLAAKSPADKKAVMDTAKTLHPAEFKQVAARRLHTITNELMGRFTKGLAEGKSPLNELINLNMRNAALMGGTVAKPVGEALAEYSAKVLDTLENGNIGDHLSALVARPPFPTTDKAVQAALKDGKEAVQASVATKAEIKANEALNKNVEAGTKVPKTRAEKKAAKAAGNKNNTEAFQQEPANIAEKAKPLDEVNTEKVFDLHYRELNRDILIRMFGTSRFFNKRSGMPITFETLAGSTHASSLLMTGFHEILRDLTRKGYTNEQLRVAFNSLKEGPPVDQISAELNGVLSAMFDTSKTNFLARNSVGPEHFNKILEKVGFDEQFRIDPLATPAEMMNAWKKWDVVDVKDFFSKMMGAMVKTAEDVSMGASFSKEFGKATPQPGYVKVVDTGTGDMRNQFIDLIDTTLYYPEEIVGEFVHIGRLLTESRSFKPGTKTHTFVTKIMDPVISNLKMTQTTMKPGHHVMSIIGDSWRNNLALSTIGFLNPARQTSLYFESARILWSNVGDIEELSAFQKFRRNQELSNELTLAKQAGGKGTGHEFYPNIKGGGKIGHKDMYALMQAHGIALPAHLGGMSEDFLTEFNTIGGRSTSKVVNAVGKVTEGLDRLANPIKPKFGMKNPYSLNKFTANRDTWTRGALFLGAMRSRNFDSVEEAINYSAAFVKKWSPTAQDLGAFEAKWLRRGIFYYTWIRGMVPRIIEGTLMRPGIATIPNKAMYNLAIANGIDPNSIGDPFPEGELFPSWYTERVIGPQYKVGDDLWGANPTGPLGDVLNALGSNVKPKDFTSIDGLMKTTGTIANMSNPFIKAPAEIISGRTLETGAPIVDRAQYAQDYVGPARFASRMLGKELYPSIGPDGQFAFANRTESKYRGGMTGEETRLNALPEILNYLTGMGFTNYTSDQATNSAEFQEKDKLIKAKREAERFQ